jgi:hypothetical protein
MVTTAPSTSYEETDLSDPDEQMYVTNNGNSTIEWDGLQRTYLLKPSEPTPIPFHVIVRYLGDPRSEYRKTETFKTPDGKMGVIPERRGELIRLSVMYGLYHGKIDQLPKKAPKVTVTTFNQIPINFPIYNPHGPVYAYQTNETAMIDARTEIERLTKKQRETDQRINELLSHITGDSGDTEDAPEDSHPGV